MLKSLLVVTGIVLVGSLAGLLGSLIAGRILGKPAAADVQTPAGGRSNAPILQYREHPPALQRRAAPLSPASPAMKRQAEDPASKGPAVDPVAEIERIKRSFADKLSAYSAQSTDVSWARSTEGVLRVGLLHTSQVAGFRATDITCHSTTCVANLEWDSYETMRANLHHAYESSHNVNCTQWALAPDDPGGGQKVTVPLLLECAEWKDQGSVPLSAQTL